MSGCPSERNVFLQQVYERLANGGEIFDKTTIIGDKAKEAFYLRFCTKGFHILQKGETF